jgi:hypothetical protein
MAPAGKVDVVPEHPHGLSNVAVDGGRRAVEAERVPLDGIASALAVERAAILLFDPFTRGPSGGPRSGGSLGLGLFISREIVRAHGGSIGVRSSATVGSTFAVRLPREPPR